MNRTIAGSPSSVADIEQMHHVYLSGGRGKCMAPHVVYEHPECPHAGCSRRMQAIDFRLEAFGRAVHDPLVTAWWDDTGFAGRCPECGRWIHFTVRGKQPLAGTEVAGLPQLPDNWVDEAVIL